MRGHDCIINNSIYIINFGQETQQKEVMFYQTTTKLIWQSIKTRSAQYINKACCLGVLLGVLYPSFTRDQCMILIRVPMYQRPTKRAVPLKKSASVKLFICWRMAVYCSPTSPLYICLLTTINKVNKGEISSLQRVSVAYRDFTTSLQDFIYYNNSPNSQFNIHSSFVGSTFS